ncbi:hypothetical protein ACFX2B_012842 [Malus domestica]
MKLQSTLEVDTKGKLKVMRHTIIHIGQSSCQQARERRHCYATITRGWGQAIVDDLKALNLGTNEESKPIFVSALLSTDEIEEYYQLLLKYKDVFA